MSRPLQLIVGAWLASWALLGCDDRPQGCTQVLAQINAGVGRVEHSQVPADGGVDGGAEVERHAQVGHEQASELGEIEIEHPGLRQAVDDYRKLADAAGSAAGKLATLRNESQSLAKKVAATQRRHVQTLAALQALCPQPAGDCEAIVQHLQGMPTTRSTAPKELARLRKWVAGLFELSPFNAEIRAALRAFSATAEERADLLGQTAKLEGRGQTTLGELDAAMEQEAKLVATINDICGAP